MNKDFFQVCPVGIVRKTEEEIFLEIYKEYEKGLLGLGEFSHLYVFCWFHKNDVGDKRGTLQVHPRGDRSNPLTGVFATRSPVRPNLIAVSLCELVSVEGTLVYIKGIDMFDNTPVLDIKPCLSVTDFSMEVKVPTWAKKGSSGGPVEMK